MWYLQPQVLNYNLGLWLIFRKPNRFEKQFKKIMKKQIKELPLLKLNADGLVISKVGQNGEVRANGFMGSEF